MIFFKDPIYFRITPLSVYITNNITRRKQLYITRRIQLISLRRQFYHPLVYLFCILIRSGSISNDAVAKQSKQRSGILKRNDESTSSVFHFISIDFVLIQKCHITYITSLLGQLYQNIRPSVTRKLRCVMSPSAFSIGQGFRVTSSSELIFWYVFLEAIWYMYYVNIFICNNFYETLSKGDNTI